MNARRKRIALFAEAVTLAHVARPLALGRGLDSAQYDVVFVCDRRYERFISGSGWAFRPIRSISGREF